MAEAEFEDFVKAGCIQAPKSTDGSDKGSGRRKGSSFQPEMCLRRKFLILESRNAMFWCILRCHQLSHT